MRAIATEIFRFNCNLKELPFIKKEILLQLRVAHYNKSFKTFKCYASNF